jgi:hypothetical protein
MMHRSSGGRSARSRRVAGIQTAMAIGLAGSFAGA